MPNAQRTAVPINLGRTEIGGAEVAGSARIWNHFEASFSATWLASSIREGEAGTLGNRVPNVPEWQIHAGLDAFWDPWFRVGWRFDYTAGSFDSPSNFFEQADRPLHSLHLRVQPGHRLPWIGVEVHNLLDTITAEQLRDPLHPDPGDTATVALEDFRGNPLPGRAVYVTMGWSPPHGGSSARTVDPETEESTR